MRTSNIVKLFSLGLSLLAAPAAWCREYKAIHGESTMDYTMIHPMHKIRGITRTFDCKVDLSPDTVTSKISVSAAVRTFDSENSNRDSHAMEVVEAMKYPRVTFESNSVKAEGDGYAVAGNLTFHGQTHPVNFHVTPHFAGKKVEITGGFAINLSDYKVSRPSLLFIPVEDKLTISFDLFSQLD